MISPEEAKSLVLAEAQPTEIETCSLIEALGRPVAEKVHSTCDVAPFAHSAMDGYALRFADLPGPFAVKAMLTVLLIALVVLALMQYVFPWANATWHLSGNADVG